MTDLEQAIADRMALERALKAVVSFVDHGAFTRPVLVLTEDQVREFTPILKEAYRCLWSEHPGK